MMKMKRELILNALAMFVAFSLVAILVANQPIMHVFAQNDTNQTDTTPPTTEISFTSEEWQNSDISITLTCDDGEGSGCDKTYYCTDTDNSCTPNTEYSATFGHSKEGTNYIRFYSVDNSGNQEETQSQILKLDTSNPAVTITAPSEGEQITEDTFIISGISSDIISGVEKVEITINGDTEEAVGTENWQYEWKNFADGTYTITAKVTDNAGNIAEASVNVEADRAPSGRIISLDNPPLVTAGRIEVSLETSEPVQFSPTLSYSFQGGSSIQIPLDGSSQSWTGFMIISEDSHNNIGTFAFSAIDFNGNQGSIITQGSYFVVDAVKPEQVASFGAEGDGKEAKLTWFYEGEPLEQFNIYRSSQSNVDYANYYKTIPPNAVSTIDDLDGKAYYYKIAAVDLAGNVGPLSEEVSATADESEEGQQSGSAQTTTQATTPTQKLPNQVLIAIDDANGRIDKKIIEIEKARLLLTEESASEELGLNLQLNEAKSKFNGFKSELEEFKKGTVTRSEIEDRIQKIGVQVLAIMNGLPKDISLESESSFIQETSLKDIEEIADLLVTGLTPREKDSYIINNQRMQSRIEIKVTAKFFKVNLFEGERYITLIKKEISSLFDMFNSSVVEVIPKTLASSVDEVNFITQGYGVLKEDPVVRWKGDIYEIKYYIGLKASEADLMHAKTLVFSDNFGSSGLFTGLTVAGRAVISTVSNIKILIPIIILALLIVFYFVYLRDGSSVFSMFGRTINSRKRRNGYSGYGYSRPRQSSLNYSYGSGIRRNHINLGNYAKPLSSPQRRQLQSISLMPREDFSEHFNEVAEKANQYIDNGNFALASKSYSLLVELYNRIDARRKRESYGEILHIHNKLNLYSKIKEINVAGRINSGMNLHSLLEHIAELYSVVVSTEGKDTKLLRFAREYYDYAASYLRI